MINIKFTSRPFDKLKTKCAVVTSFSDQLPFCANAALVDWRLNGRLSRFCQQKRFKCDFEETLLMPSEGRVLAEQIIFLGLGEKARFDEAKVSHLIQYLLSMLAKKGASEFMVSFCDIVSDRFEWRNSIRLMVSKLLDYSKMETVYLCESEDCVRDAKKRHMDFGMNVDVSFETVN